jgi:hypothetical protein
MAQLKLSQTIHIYLGNLESTEKAGKGKKPEKILSYAIFLCILHRLDVILSLSMGAMGPDGPRSAS